MKIRISFFLIALLLIACEPENIAPDARFTCIPPEGNINTLFDLDARSAEDPDGLKNLLLYRWDYDGDGQWDTSFGPFSITSHRYPDPGTYSVRLEVKDTYDAVSQFAYTLKVDSLHHFTDPRDGQVYPIVKLGSFWWMGRNLNVGKRIDPAFMQAHNGVIEKYVYPGDDPDSLYGGLYTWAEMMDNSSTEGSQGICPPGWHVPSDGDWRNMLSVFRAVGRISPQVYKVWGEKFVPDQTVTHDNYQSEGAVWRLLKETGSTGFNAIPLGYCDPDRNFGDRDYHFQGRISTWWSSTLSYDYAVRVRLYRDDNQSGDVFRFADNIKYAFSVRCVKESL